MAATLARAAVKPENRKTRAVAARASENYNNTGINGHSELSARLQRLGQDFALFGPLAETVALLAWGVNSHGR